MATEELRITIEQAVGLAKELEALGIQALVDAIRPVKAQVMDFTPRLHGGLINRIDTRVEDGGRTRVVYGDGVVMATHENNGQWRTLPPHKPLKEWVGARLGIYGEEGDRVAGKVRWKILRKGLTLPNAQRRGKMFQRTEELMEKTKAHFIGFRVAMKRLIQQRGARRSKGA